MPIEQGFVGPRPESFPVEDFVAIDVEIASRRPTSVCAIGAVRVERGREVQCMESLIRYQGTVHFTRVHGLRAIDLREAPEWPAVWRSVTAMALGLSVVVAFRAEFDRGAILAMCGRHHVRVPALRFHCAARAAEARLGRRLNLADTVAALGLTFPGRPHDALSDARAAAAVFLACQP